MTIFSHFGPPNNLENQNFGKMKKTPREIIILYKCTINDDHLMYDSWDKKHDRQNFLSFWTIFCPFKIEILKKWKKTPGDTILHLCTINENHIMYDSWDVEHNRYNFLSFWAFFAFLPHSQTKKSKLWKYEKTPGDIIILQKSTKNHDHMLYSSWDIACDRCNCYFWFWAIFFYFFYFSWFYKKSTKNHDMLYSSWDMACDGCNLFLILGYFFRWVPHLKSSLRLAFGAYFLHDFSIKMFLI